MSLYAEFGSSKFGKELSSNFYLKFITISSLLLLLVSHRLDAQEAIDLPEPDNQAAPYEMSVTLPDNDAAELLSRHQSICGKLGAARCAVTALRAPGENAYGSMRFILVKGLAPNFIAELSKASPYGFEVHRPRIQSGDQSARAELEIQLLQAQLQKLDQLKSENSKISDILIQREKATVQTRISEYILKKNNIKENNVSDILTVNYRQSDGYRPKFMSYIGRFFDIFGLSILAVIGVAILTVIYTGILWMSFKAVKRFTFRKVNEIPENI